MISVFTTLKNADLACLSAKDALISFMGNTTLVNLHRYTQWDLHIDGDSSDVNGLVEDVLEKSYYLANPNKENYFINELPAHEQHYHYHLKVSPKNHADDSYTRTKIKGTFPIPITKIETSTLWDIVVDTPPSNELEQYILETIVVSSSQSKGLLVNPLYEEFVLTQA